MNAARDMAWLGQPHMVKKIEKVFGEMTSSMMKYQTPGTPNHGLILAKEEKDKLDPERHSLFRTGTGMALYLIKHSRPDIANAVRELSKCISAPNAAAFKEMLRILKYIIDTKNYGLKVKPVKSEEWYIEVYSDSDWAGDKDTRKSVTGYVIFVCGVLVCFRSKSQQCISLSSSEV